MHTNNYFASLLFKSSVEELLVRHLACYAWRIGLLLDYWTIELRVPAKKKTQSRPECQVCILQAKLKQNRIAMVKHNTVGYDTIHQLQCKTNPLSVQYEKIIKPSSEE
jgi:hypothetical protein